MRASIAPRSARGECYNLGDFMYGERIYATYSKPRRRRPRTLSWGDDYSPECSCRDMAFHLCLHRGVSRCFRGLCPSDALGAFDYRMESDQWRDAAYW